MQHELESLDWNDVLERVISCARSEPARGKLRELIDPSSWASDIEGARSLQDLAGECLDLSLKGAVWSSLEGLGSVDVALSTLKKGGVLGVSEVYLLSRWLEVFDTWKSLPPEESPGPLWKQMTQLILDPLELLRRLAPILGPDGEIKETASLKLREVSSEIRRKKSSIEDLLEKVLNDWDQRGLLQDRVRDFRSGHYVLSVKSSSQSPALGKLVEYSVSGQTIYIEPLSVSEARAELRQLELERDKEIFRILSELSEDLRPWAVPFGESVAEVVKWDVAGAKVKWGMKTGGRPIEVMDEMVFTLKSVAHPLLWETHPEKEIIRNDFFIDVDQRILLISGPNTGGKTVFLKTLGLASIFARVGMLLPGIGQPQVPFVDRIFVDLGDMQSIERHISSFSGHILKLKEALDGLTPRSLILIDEMNSATDPEEGAALAHAFLETILEQSQAVVIATTHDPKLKALSATDERYVCASMMFDEARLTPLYRLVIGIPGRSRALDVARKLGLPERLIQLATDKLSKEGIKVNSLIERLEDKVRQIEHQSRETLRLQEEAQALKDRWTERSKKALEEILEQSRKKIQRIVQQTEDEARITLKKFSDVRTRVPIDSLHQTLKKTVGASQEQIHETLKENAPELESVLESVLTQKVPEVETEYEAHVGAKVRIPKWKSLGTITKIKGDKLVVQSTSGLNMTLSRAEVQVLPPEKDSTKSHPKSSSSSLQVQAPEVDPQLDLRGIRYEEAMSKLESYLDQAVRSSRGEVLIIHGIGTGSLREGTRGLLSKLPYVKEFKDAGPGQGGTGATLVIFE